MYISIMVIAEIIVLDMLRHNRVRFTAAFRHFMQRRGVVRLRIVKLTLITRREKRLLVRIVPFVRHAFVDVYVG